MNSKTYKAYFKCIIYSYTIMSSCIEYVWIGGNNELRSKTKVINSNVIQLSDIPIWNYDGSSTGQATTCESEVVLIPVAMFNDPFRDYKHDKLVLCDSYNPNGEPISTNTRARANEIFNQRIEEEPWFGLEQEYFMINSGTNLPLGFDDKNTQGQYYCSVGTDNAFGRKLAETHMHYCIKAGIKISGMNAEVAPGQWEFQVGPCIGIEAGDHLWMARYILHKLSEEYNIIINMEPKPLSGDWNGSGCHTNYSTKSMREGTQNKKGIVYISDAINKLSIKHTEHMAIYGSNNHMRMTGQHETSSYDVFSFGTTNRGASVRIGNENMKNEKGYFEDRRPSSNCDPYLVTSMIFKTTCLYDE
jgi:glutamine synthetase